MLAGWYMCLVEYSSILKTYLNAPLKKSVSYIGCFDADGKWTIKKWSGGPCALKTSITQHSLLLGYMGLFCSELILLTRKFY